MRQPEGRDWVFCSRRGTPLNPGNALKLKRYIRPAAAALGIALGGWHDFRHTLTTTMSRKRVHPKVISGILRRAKVLLAMDIYDHTNLEDFRKPWRLWRNGCYQVFPSLLRPLDRDV